MDILYISQYYPPEMGAPSARVSELSKYWVKFGNNVTVITGMPNHPDGIIHPTYKWEYFKEERKFGVRVLRVLLYVTPNKGVIKRVISFLSFMITSFIVGILKSGTDVVIATSPQLFVGLSGLIIAKLKGKPFIFEVRDIWPQSAVELGVISNRFIIAAMERLECLLYVKASKIIVAVKGMEKIISQKGIDPQKIHFIPNGIDAERFKSEKRTILRNRKHLQGKFLVGYAGTIGMAHGLDIIPKTARLLEDTNIHFVIIGSGAEREKISDIIEKEHLNNVTMLGKMPQETIPSVLSELDMGFVHLKDFPLMHNAVPSKIYEIMASGTPVLAGISGIGRRFIEESGLGYVFRQEDPNDMAQVLRKIIREPKEKLNDIGRHSEQIAFAKFSREDLAYKYLNYLKEASSD